MKKIEAPQDKIFGKRKWIYGFVFAFLELLLLFYIILRFKTESVKIVGKWYVYLNAIVLIAYPFHNVLNKFFVDKISKWLHKDD